MQQPAKKSNDALPKDLKQNSVNLSEDESPPESVSQEINRSTNFQSFGIPDNSEVKMTKNNSSNLVTSSDGKEKELSMRGTDLEEE